MPLLGTHFVNDFFGNVMPVVLPLLQTKLGLSLALVGIVSTAHTAVTSGAQLLFGGLGDRFQKVNFVLWGPLISGTFLSLAGLSPNLPLLLVTVVLAGLGSAMFHPQATATAGGLSQQRRGTVISLFIGSGRVGASLAPLVAGVLFGVLGLANGSWMLLGGMGLVTFVLLRSVPSPLPPKVSSDQLQEVFKPLLPLWVLVVLRHIVFMSFSTYLIFLLQTRGFSYEVAAGVGLFLFMLGGAAGSLLGGPLSDRFSRRQLTVGSFLVTTPCFWLFLHSGGITSLVWLTLSGVVLLANNPMIVAQAQERVPGHEGTASAVVMGLGWLVGTLFISPVGALADVIGIEAALNWIIWTPLLAGALAWRFVKGATASAA